MDVQSYWTYYTRWWSKSQGLIVIPDQPKILSFMGQNTARTKSRRCIKVEFYDQISDIRSEIYILYICYIFLGDFFNIFYIHILMSISQEYILQILRQRYWACKPLISSSITTFLINHFLDLKSLLVVFNNITTSWILSHMCRAIVEGLTNVLAQMTVVNQTSNNAPICFKNRYLISFETSREMRLLFERNHIFCTVYILFGDRIIIRGWDHNIQN